MSTTNNNALVATAPNFSSDGSDTTQTALAHARPQHVGIRRKTIFDLTETEFNRLEILAQTYAASAFNSGRNSNSVHDYKLIMLKGLELGISPMAAVDMINIIHGTPVLDAKGMLALVKSSGLLENIKIDSTDERCVVYIKRSNEEAHTESFSMEDANRFMTFEKGQRIPLAKKHNWRSQPRVMLKWRAVTAACRAVFSDIIGGLYTPEEIDTDNTLVQEDGSMSWEPPENNSKSLPGSTSNNANQSDTPDWWTPDNRGKLAGFIRKRGWSEAEKTNDILQDAADILGLDSYHALSEYEAGNAVVEALKEATKALESDQSDASDDDNKVINHPAKNDTARTEAASKSNQNAADEPPVTWTSEDSRKYNEWLEANFDIDIEEAIHRDAIEDLTLFENFADARKKTVAHAVQNQWPVVVTDGTYTEANSNYINFSSAIGNIRWYGRSKLAEAAPEWNLAVNVTEWQPGESHRFSQEPLLLSWDDKGHYRVATAVVQIGDKVPF